MAQLGVVDSPGKIHQMLIQLDNADKSGNPYQAQLLRQAIDNVTQELEIKDQKRLIQEQATRLSKAESRYHTANKELQAAKIDLIQNDVDVQQVEAQRNSAQQIINDGRGIRLAR